MGHFLIRSVYKTIDSGISSVVASSTCLVEVLLAIFWAVFTGFFSLSRAKEVFYASPRICSSFQNREELFVHFEKRCCLFLALQKVAMVLKTL